MKLKKIKSYKKFSISKTKGKLSDSWKSFINIAKRETNETGKLILLLKKSINGVKLTDGEIKYIKNQSGDIAKIIGIMAMGSVSMIIPIALNKALKKWNIDIMPRDHRHFLEKEEKDNESDK
jgi:Zn-dependent metalloprotease